MRNWQGDPNQTLTAFFAGGGGGKESRRRKRQRPLQLLPRVKDTGGWIWRLCTVYADPAKGLSTEIHSHLAIHSIWLNSSRLAVGTPKRALTSVRVPFGMASLLLSLFHRYLAALISAMTPWPPFYTDDAVLVVPEGLIYGRKAIAKSWTDLFEKGQQVTEAAQRVLARELELRQHEGLGSPRASARGTTKPAEVCPLFLPVSDLGEFLEPP